MKYKNIVKYFLCALSAVAMLGSCAQKEFEEITTISLKRCLEPQKLYARVDLATGNQVTFGWDVNKDADEYELLVYSDQEMTKQAFHWTLSPDQIPYKAELVADQKYYFTVQAYRLDADGFPIEESLSNLAKYDGEIKTRAVAKNLFPEVTARTSSSISLAWSNELEDYLNVTHIEARPVRGGKTVELELTDAMQKAAAATVEGLEASKEYQVTLCYYSASRGALDVWTMAEQGSMVTVTTSEELLSIVTNGGEAYVALSGSPYTIGASKPKASVKLVGEIGADGEKPVVIGQFNPTGETAANSSFYFEGIKFDDGLVHNHMFNLTGKDEILISSIKLVNCEMTAFGAGILYHPDGEGSLALDELSFDSCDIYDVATNLKGDFIDLRKTNATLGLISFVNCSIYDGVRTLLRTDTKEGIDIKIGNIVFENNTVKAIAAVEHKDNRGLFALRYKTNMSLKKNLFLYEDVPGMAGTDGEGDKMTYKDKCQLFQYNASTVIPELNAEDNYAFEVGDAFFSKVSAKNAVTTVLKEDPCYNSKGNNFYLTNPELLDKQIGAYKWQLTYEEKVEDLTQNVVAAPHVWNLQDAKLFAGTAKNSRVRDELLIVATEENPINIDGAVKFLNATPRTKKGVPTEGYIAFKVDKAGSVDILVTDPDKAGGTVSIALQDDNGFAVQGGAAASASNPSVQKVVIPEVKGEGTVYIFATAPAAITKLAWSQDVLAGSRVLATPKPIVEPVTVMEGDATEVSITWDAIDNADHYVVVFNKRIQDPQTETSFTVSAESVAALKAGLYTFTVQAFPSEDDIYYTESEIGGTSFAVLPVSQGGEEMKEVTLTWDFSDADWQAIMHTEARPNANTNYPNWDISLNGLRYVSPSNSRWNPTNIQAGGAGKCEIVVDEENPGGVEKRDRVFTFTALGAGYVYVKVSGTSGTAATDGRSVCVQKGLDTSTKQSQFAGFSSNSPEVLEFEVEAGEVNIYPTNGIRFYVIEFTYMSGPAPKEDYAWDFSDSDWQAIMHTEARPTANTNYPNWDISLNGLRYVSPSNSRWNPTNIQAGGAGKCEIVVDEENPGGVEKRDRVFTFTALGAGYVYVKVSGTSGTAATDGRSVCVQKGLDTSTKQSQFAGFSSNSPEVLEFEVEAGEVNIYPTNGIRFYTIEFHTDAK